MENILKYEILNSHILGMAAVLKSAGIEHFHQCKEFFWVVLESAGGIISTL